MATEVATLLGLLQELCRLLKLPTVLRNAALLDEAARRKGQEPLAYLVELLSLEVEERRDRSSQRRIKEAGFPVVKTPAGFDFSRNPALPEALLPQLAGGHFIEEAEPIVFLGEPGTGKTHLACALGVAAARLGHSVRFVTAARLVTELVEAKDSRELNRVVDRLTHRGHTIDTGEDSEHLKETMRRIAARRISEATSPAAT